MKAKTAITEFRLNDLIYRRYSPRTFEPIIPEREVLLRIFEAVRWAPSSMNEQPWRIIAGIKGSNTYQKIFNSLVDFNQKWAHLAPVLILIYGNKISSKTGLQNAAYLYDCGQAAAYLTFQAMHEGLFCHQMGGFDKDIIIRDFYLSDQFEPVSIVALGYPGKLDYLQESFKKLELAERSRKPLEDIVIIDYQVSSQVQ